MNKNIIFCDVDQTLVDSNEQISSLTIKKLQWLINEPHPHNEFMFCLISGRNNVNEKFIYDQLGIKENSYLVGSNGTQIYSLKEHQLIKQYGLEAEVANKIFKKLMQLRENNPNIIVWVSYGHQPYYYFIPYDEQAWQKHNASHQLQLKDHFEPNDVLTISPRQLSQRDYDEFIEFLKQFKNIHVVGAKEIMAVSHEGINKRSAIEYILNLENIPSNHVCVIGDSENDVSMFEIPGVYSITYATAKPCLMPLACDIVNAPISEFIATGIDDFVKHLNHEENSHKEQDE